MNEADRLIREQMAKALDPARQDPAFRARLTKSIEENRPILDRLAESDHGTGPVLDERGLPPRPIEGGPVRWYGAHSVPEDTALLRVGDGWNAPDGYVRVWDGEEWKRVEPPPPHVHGVACAFGCPTCPEFASPERDNPERALLARIIGYTLLSLLVIAVIVAAVYFAIPEESRWTP